MMFIHMTQDIHYKFVHAVGLMVGSAVGTRVGLAETEGTNVGFADGFAVGTERRLIVSCVMHRNN